MTGHIPVALGGSTRGRSIVLQMEEMLALQELERERGLLPHESERLGQLVYREQQRARYRPARIARLRAELELLETLEIAQRGADAVPEPREIDMVQSEGSWAAPLRAVA